MEKCNTLEKTTRCIRVMACATVLAAAFTVPLPQSARADRVNPPPVPTDIEVPAGNKAFLVGHAVGTQNYVCLPSDGGVKFVLFTPQATLFADNDRQIITHFFSPNPFEDGTPIRATWQDSKDTSTVWAGKAIASTDPNFVDPDAVAWLRLEVVGAQDGPTGGHTLTATTFIQRLNTTGGLAPSDGCASDDDVGNEAFVPYTADYFFYEKTPGSDASDGNH